MKKYALTLLSLLLITASFAQFTYGPKVGVNFSRYSGDTPLPGFQAGGFLNAEFDDRMGLQIDFLWTLKGNLHSEKLSSPNIATITNTTTSTTYTLITGYTDYTANTTTYYRIVDLPICAYFPISKHLRGFAGPQISAYRKAHQVYKPSIGKTTEKDLSGFKGKVALCAGFDFVLDSPISIGLRFTTNKFTQSSTTLNPLTSQNETSTDSRTLNSFMINIGYRMDW